MRVWSLFMNGEISRGGGWLSRANRLVEIVEPACHLRGGGSEGLFLVALGRVREGLERLDEAIIDITSLRTLGRLRGTLPRCGQYLYLTVSGRS